ncbi:hypothetical protein ABE79_10625, partial [Proteus mirabilis]
GQRYAVNQLGGSVALWNSYQTTYGKLTPSLNLRYFKDIAGDNNINQRHSLTYFNTEEVPSILKEIVLVATLLVLN